MASSSTYAIFQSAVEVPHCSLQHLSWDTTNLFLDSLFQFIQCLWPSHVDPILKVAPQEKITNGQIRWRNSSFSFPLASGELCIRKHGKYIVMLDLLTVAYIQFMIMLIELQNLLNSGTKFLVLQDYHILSMVKPTRCTNVSNLFYFILFFGITIRILDGLSIHQQKFTTVYIATGMCQTCTAVCLLAGW